MRKSTKILATVTALGALMSASLAFSAPDKQTTSPQTRPACPMAGYSMSDRMDARLEGIARMLTLEDNQKAAWENYVKASKALHMKKGKTYDKPAADMQERLERRAERAQNRADSLKAYAAARAELLKVLNPSQKYVLEQVEATHGRMGGAMMHPHGGMPMDPHHGMMMRKYHHGGMMGAPADEGKPAAEAETQKM